MRRRLLPGPREAEDDAAAAAEVFASTGPVIDVQTHLVDPARWDGTGAEALAGFLQLVDPERWPGPVDPQLIDGAAWAALVFGSSETAIALLTSTPGGEDRNVLTNRQIAVTRDVVDRYTDSGRVHTHAIVHPNLGDQELDDMERVHAQLRPSGWKCYTLYGPPTAASPAGGWFLDDDEFGFPFLERVRDLGHRVVATHKGLGGAVPKRRWPRRRRVTSARRLRRSPTCSSSCTTRGTSGTRWRRKARTTPRNRRSASTAWWRASTTQGSGRAPTCTRSSAPPGS